MTDAALAPLLIGAPTGPAVTTERYGVRVVLVTTAVVFLVLFLLLPLMAVFVEAFRAGLGAYFAAITEPDAVAAIKLTLLGRRYRRSRQYRVRTRGFLGHRQVRVQGQERIEHADRSSLLGVAGDLGPDLCAPVRRTGLFRALSPEPQHSGHLRAAGHRARHDLRHLPLRRPRARALDAGAGDAGRGSGAVAWARAAGRPSSG